MKSSLRYQVSQKQIFTSDLAATFRFSMSSGNLSKHSRPATLIRSRISFGSGDSTIYNKTIFIPVSNQPLSANCYYVICRLGKHQGKARTSSKEEDVATCLCCKFAHDVKPSPLDPSSTYQQVEIVKKRFGFQAKSIAPDGIPQDYLRRNGWNVSASTPCEYHLDEALGLNSDLRARSPDFNFPLSNDHSESVAVGKWYCPFMFVKEENSILKDQKKISVFYEMTLEQRWAKIFSKENSSSDENNAVDVVVETEVAKIGGRNAVWDEKKCE